MILRLRSNSGRILTILAVILFAPSPGSAFQEETPTAPPPTPADPAATQLQTELTDLQTTLTTAQIDEAQRKELTASLDTASKELEAATAQIRNAGDIRAETAKMSEEAAALEKVNESQDTAANLRQLTDVQLDARLAEAQVASGELRRQLADYETAAKSVTERRRLWQVQATTLKTNLDDVEKQLRETGDPAQLSTRIIRFGLMARRFRLKAEEQVLEAERSRLDTELALNLPALRISSQKQKIRQNDEELQRLQEETKRRRQVESVQQMARAREAEESSAMLNSAALRETVSRRSDLARENRILATQTIPDRESQLQSRQNLVKTLEEGANKIRERIRRFGAARNVGQDLLYFRRRLPDATQVSTELRTLEDELSALYIDQLDYADEVDHLEAIVDREGDGFRDAEREFVEGYRETLRVLEENALQLSSILTDLKYKNQDLLNLIHDWEDYASEQSLWLRSDAALTLQDLRDFVPHAAGATQANLKSILALPSSQTYSVWFVVVPLALACGVLVLLHDKAKAGIAQRAVAARRRSCITVFPTLRAMLLTFALAAAVPVGILIFSSLLQLSGRDDSARHLGNALRDFSLIILWLTTFRQSLREDGLAVAHFGWGPVVCAQLRSWLRGVGIVCGTALLAFLIVRHASADTNNIERIVFCLLMITISVFIGRLLLPASSTIVRHTASRSHAWRKTRWLWRIVPVVIPLALGVLSFTGFHYTAIQITERLASTLVILSIVVLIHELLCRWLLVASTGTRLMLAKQRAEERARQQEEEGGEQTDAQSTIPPVPSEEVEFELFGLEATALVTNAALLISIGCLWVIWSDVLPALRILDRYPVWHVTETVAVEGSEEGAEVSSRIERRAVTAGDLVIAVLALFMTFFSVRQVPSLIELVMQSRGCEAGLRYAVSTICRYVLLTSGVVVVCQMVGLRWTQIQWLAAGLSVGLGFGLQEVFANFVSGIIILAERPIRIGDIVTIDGVSGIVSRIRIRATCITDWDRREYIVPNREFVTGKLLNWTLSDTTNRIVVNVGIAYGSNVDRAREIMMEVVTEHPNIMEDPAPLTTFENFGDSSLDLVLRAYLPNLENRLATISDVHTEINRRFIDEGITIPFPQRDLNVYLREGFDQSKLIEKPSE